MKRAFALLMALALMMVSLGSVAAQTELSQEPVDPQEGCDYYEETGHNLCDVFLSYWENNGGLPVFGFPITEAFEEENLDTGGTYLVQYFERERMEHHPALAGSVYEVLLGRLGNEVLLMQGRNWLEFEKSDPSEANYFAETGFAVPDVFMAYWTSHGLDFGDVGDKGEEEYSFRESLALFGYPISQAEVETNADGDTVLTQWFERARFEHHPDNPEGQQVLLGRLGVEILAGEEPEPPPPAEDDFTVIVDGLDNPRHFGMGADGALYVAEAGAGGEECVGADPEDPEFVICFGASGSIIQIVDGEEQVVVDDLPSFSFGEGDAIGVHDVAVGADGTMYAVAGLDATAEERDMVAPELTSVDAAGFFGHLLQINPDGTWESIADLAAYESANNTDDYVDPEEFGGMPDLFSNPYALMVVEDGWLVVDAGANALLHVDAEGTITPVAVFPPQMVEAPPFLELPEGTQIPMQAVPTSIEVGPDGAYYVGQLTGFPFVVDSASVWRVVPGEDPEIYATGFTNLGDIAFDSEGNLYVLEIVEAGLLAAEAVIFGGEGDITDFPGAVIKVDQEGNHSEVADNGLAFPTGMTITADGSIYVSNWGIMPGMGQVVLLDETAAGEPEPPPPAEPDFTVLAEGLEQPRHISVGGDGVLYVAVAGSGGDECVVAGEDPESGEDIEVCFGNSGSILSITDGEVATVVDGLPSVLQMGDGVGVHDVAVTADGDIYAVTGLGADAAGRDALGEVAEFFGLLVQIHEDGTWTEIADLAAYESDANPDPEFVDSNPYSLLIDGDNFIVVDAGGNTLLQVTPEGDISTLAVFPAQMVLAPPFLGLPEGTEIPMESVPTSVVMGPDGAYYVGELTGFPFADGAARVWRVVPGEDPEVFATGFTNIGALDFDAEGNLYVLEIVAGGLLNADPANPASAASAITMVAEDETQTVLDTEGLIFSTGMAIDADGSVYATNMTVFPGAGQVVMLD